jgi:hypothetical protein
MKFRVKHDFGKSQPAWRGTYPRLFGERNQGFVVEARDLEDAKRILRDERNLNPFYLFIALEARDTA